VWEEDKYVSVSRRRFERVAEVGGKLHVTLIGAPHELVGLMALRPRYESGGQKAVAVWTVVSVRATISPSGRTTLVIK
jgi:hypothetical protein